MTVQIVTKCTLETIEDTLNQLQPHRKKICGKKVDAENVVAEQNNGY